MPKPKKRQRTKSETAAPISRRSMLQKIAIFGGGGAALAAGGTLFAFDFRSKLAETDLTKIGQGASTIVQIHDPSCSLCQALQRETRSALRDCDEDYLYLVANIKTDDGAAFSALMGEPHVTLVLLDGNGTHLHTINGVTDAALLKDAFRTYFS